MGNDSDNSSNNYNNKDWSLNISIQDVYEERKEESNISNDDIFDD